ncbi:MAG: phenylacetate--CoA ligase family protein [Proteobacteria bacterium]|nr:phenylacetate--CoA ligase family protein [Pseudomonadota bacterium]
MLEATQWQSHKEIEALQYRKLAVLARHSAAHSAQFRTRLHAANLTAQDLASPDGLARLPLLSRRELQRAKDLFCTETPSAHLPTYETRTSGSTGEPVLVRRTAYSQIDWLSTTMREHLWHERDFLSPFCAIRANISKLIRLENWGAPAALLRKTGPALGIPIVTDIATQTALICEFKPQTLLIYPSNLAALVQHCADHNIAIPSLKKIITIGETSSPDIRTRAEIAFGADVSDMYSSQEAGNIALQCGQSDLYHVMAENLIVEIVDEHGVAAGEGETGRVVLTDLNNFATPLIRYDIGDYAESGPACSCGRGLPTLKRILGRERNLIRMPDGSRHWPLVGFHKFREIAPILQYQMIQPDREHIELRIVAERPLTIEEKSKLVAHVQTSLGHPFLLTVSCFDGKIPTAASGKFEEFVSHAH